MSLMRWGLSIALMALFACGSSNMPSEQTAYDIALSNGNTQFGEAGHQLADSLEVVVRRAGSTTAARNVAVHWHVASGAGVVSPVRSVTDARGIARTSFTLGPNAGPQTVVGTLGSTEIVFQATARVYGAVRMGHRSIGPLADTTLGTNNEPLVVLVLDERGAPVRGVVVHWTATGGGSVSETEMPTDAGGESIVYYTYGAKAGMYGAEARVDGLIGSPVSFELHGLPGNPTQLAKSNGDSLTVTAGERVVHTVMALDARGNPAHGVRIEWATAIGGGSITPQTNFTHKGGLAEAVRTLGESEGLQTVVASAPDMPASPRVTFSTLAARRR